MTIYNQMYSRTQQRLFLRDLVLQTYHRRKLNANSVETTFIFHYKATILFTFLISNAENIQMTTGTVTIFCIRIIKITKYIKKSPWYLSSIQIYDASWLLKYGEVQRKRKHWKTFLNLESFTWETCYTGNDERTTKLWQNLFSVNILSKFYCREGSYFPRLWNKTLAESFLFLLVASCCICITNI
jgi:hypothetical protein